MVPYRRSRTKVTFQERVTVALGGNSHSALAGVGDDCWCVYNKEADAGTQLSSPFWQFLMSSLGKMSVCATACVNACRNLEDYYTWSDQTAWLWSPEWAQNRRKESCLFPPKNCSWAGTLELSLPRLGYSCLSVWHLHLAWNTLHTGRDTDRISGLLVYQEQGVAALQASWGCCSSPWRRSPSADRGDGWAGAVWAVTAMGW